MKTEPIIQSNVTQDVFRRIFSSLERARQLEQEASQIRQKAVLQIVASAMERADRVPVEYGPPHIDLSSQVRAQQIHRHRRWKEIPENKKKQVIELMPELGPTAIAKKTGISISSIYRIKEEQDHHKEPVHSVA